MESKVCSKCQKEKILEEFKRTHKQRNSWKWTVSLMDKASVYETEE